MSKESKIVTFSFLLIISIALLIFMFIARYNLYLNEYNAQMQQFGFYKEDIHVLNQTVQSFFITAGIVVLIPLSIGWGFGLFFSAIE